MSKQSNNIHKNHRERMRQRIMKDGIESLQDHELLEYLLYAYIPRKDTNPIAHNLINAAGSLEKVFNSPAEFLERIPNMTRSAALFLSNMSKICKRYEERKSDKKVTFTNSQDTMAYFKDLLEDELEEHVYVALIGPSGLLVDLSKLSSGNTAQCKLDIKKLILKMAAYPAKDVIIVHNHPSGNPTPSREDFAFTKWLTTFFSSMELNFIDHIIVSRNGCYSFRGSGALSAYAKEYKNYCESLHTD